MSYKIKHSGVQASEGRITALKQQQTNGVKQEASLAAEAEAHARNVSERDQTLRSASTQAGVGQLPANNLAEESVDGYSHLPSPPNAIHRRKGCSAYSLPACRRRHVSFQSIAYLSLSLYHPVQPRVVTKQLLRMGEEANRAEVRRTSTLMMQNQPGLLSSRRRA